MIVRRLGLGGRLGRHYSPLSPLLALLVLVLLSASALAAPTRTPQPTNPPDPTDTTKPTRTPINPLATDTPTPRGKTPTPTRTRPGGGGATPTRTTGAVATSTTDPNQPTPTRTRPVQRTNTPTFGEEPPTETPTESEPESTPTRTRPGARTPTRTTAVATSTRGARTNTPGIATPRPTKTPKPTSTPRDRGPLRVSFRAAGEFASTNGPTGIVLADFDPDTVPDAALISRDTDVLQILLGERPNMFHPGPSAPATGREPVALVTADLDGDGDSDLVVAEATDGTVSTYFNDGGGNFALGRHLSVGGEPSALAAFDSRFAVTDRFNSRVLLLNRSGGGVLAIADSIPTAAEPIAIAAADMNRDGRTDLVTANDVGQSATVLLANTSGGFDAPRTVPLLSFPGALSLGDFDNDGCADLAVTLPFVGRIAVYKQGSSGGGGGQNTCHGDFSLVYDTEVAAPSIIVLVDDQAIRLTGDTFPDLVVLSAGTSMLSIFEGQIPGTTPAFNLVSRFTVGKGAAALALGQIDRDVEDFVDLVIANREGDSVQIVRNSTTGGGSFVAPVTFETDLGPSSTVLGDFDWQKDCTGDTTACTADVLTANLNAGSLSFFPGNGLGNLRRRVDTPILAGPSLMTSGDFHNTGRLDVVIASTIQSNAALYHSRGDGTFEAERQLNVAGSPTALGTGDYNGDGQLDLVLAWSDAPSFGVDVYAELPGNPNARLQLPGNGAAVDVAIADVNNDGTADIVALVPDLNQIEVWYQLQDGRFSDLTTFDTVVRPTHMVLADLNDDGQIDAVTANHESFNFGILFGRNGGFRAPRFTSLPDQPVAVSAEDFNLDGAIDLAFLSDISGRVTVFAGEGDGTFPDGVVTRFASGVEPQSFAIGNLTNDQLRGDPLPDIIVADYSTDRVTVLRNNSDVPRVEPTPRPTSTPRPLGSSSGGGCNMPDRGSSPTLVLLLAAAALVLRAYAGGRRA